MKKLIIIFISALVLSSCEKMLEEKPYNVISPANFYRTQQEIEAAANGTIGLFRGNNLYAWFLHYMTQWVSGDYDSPFGEFTQLSWTSAYPLIPQAWSEFFKVIDNCNNILDRIDAVEFDENRKKAIKGEILFLRALSNFNLTRLYGDIPINLTPTRTPEDALKPREARKKVYEQIVSDLKEASNLLGVTNPYGPGRANKGAAQALLAKTYVYMASKPLNDATKWKDALDLLKTMVNPANPSQSVAPYTYRLESDYQKLFFKVTKFGGGAIAPVGVTPANENGPESVYELNYKFIAGVNNAAVFPRALAGVQCSKWLAGKFEEQDYRKQVTMVVSATDPYGLERTNRKFSPTGVGFDDSDNNWYVIRFADLVLLLAEAENEVNGPTSTVLACLNAIRARARAADGTARTVPADYGITDISSKEAARLLIEKERILELSCEGNNWFDWIRTNRLQAVLTEQGRGSFYKASREIYPVPQVEIDVSQGVLKQNEGY